MTPGGSRRGPAVRRRAARSLVHVAAALAVLLGSVPSALADSRAPASGIRWPEGQALPRFASPAHLDVVDVDPATCGCTADDALMLATLQGLVNRERPRLYLVRAGDESREWLDDLEVPHDRATEWEAVGRYRAAVSGVVEYDPRVPDTIDVATAIAGLTGAVVAGPSLAAQLRDRAGLPVLVDLATLHFRSGEDAYRWALTAVWPRTTHRMLVAVLPRASAFMRDYAVANRAMVVWLDPARPDDAQLLDAYLAGMPPDSPYLGWFPGFDAGEHLGVAQLSRHAVSTVAADFAMNLTVLSGTRAGSGHRRRDVEVPPLGNRVYLTLTMTDGDNIQYVEHAMRRLWDDPARGRVPINWSVQPLLVDAAPALLDHYRSTATPDDTLVSGPSGAGYMYPDVWPASRLHAYAERTARYMHAAGVDILYVFGRAPGPGLFGGEVARTYADVVAPRGVLLADPGTVSADVVDGVPVVDGPTACAADLGGVIDGLTRRWDGSAPLFLSLGAVAWCATPSALVTLVRSLDSRFTVVDAEAFSRLLRESRRAHG